LSKQRLSPGISAALGRGATLVVPNAQRQAAVRAAWAGQQRSLGKALWGTPRVFTFAQYAERRLAAQWAADNLPDRLLPPGAEWVLLRQLRRDAGHAEARALLAAVRALHDWSIPASQSTLGASPEGDLLLQALDALDAQRRTLGRRPLRAWLDDIVAADGELLTVGIDTLPRAQRAMLGRLGAAEVDAGPSMASVAVATARDDEHELELIGAWCRRELEADPSRRLLIVDANLRQRRRQYERLLSQTLSPSEWLSPEAREFSRYFSIEGGQSLAEFPIVAHALLTLRLLTGTLRFDELLLWLRMPFLDRGDVLAGATIEAALREGHRLEYGAAALAAFLEMQAGEAAAGLAARLRQGLDSLGRDRHLAPDWAPRIQAALRAAGWHGSRPMRTDEQQTVARWHALLDEFSALGAWLGRVDAAGAVATLSDLARERNFDPASVDAAVTLTDSQDDPVVRYDAIWVAGVDAAQWPPPPRPDVFIPLRLQVEAGIPAASAAGQARRAREALTAWRAATGSLVCSWAQLDGDAHRTASPLLLRLPGRVDHLDPHGTKSLASQLRVPRLEAFEDVLGLPVNRALPVRGGVKPLTLQAECGFHAYGEVRLAGEALEQPAPGIDARDRGRLLHKALELVWSKFDRNFLTVSASDAQSRKPAIENSVRAAITHVYPRIPPELQRAVEREASRLEKLIEALFKEESRRTTFHIESLEALRTVQIAGGSFEVRIDRVDALQGGGFAILDYKTGEPRKPRWKDDGVRDPQLLAYLLAERGRDIQALANVSLTRGRARFVGKASRTGLLPDVDGLNPNKIPADRIDAAWHAAVEGWVASLTRIAEAYLEGEAPVQPAPDVCRHCHLTVLCRRVELASVDLEEEVDP
jgi:probable DNA repair protein